MPEDVHAQETVYIRAGADPGDFLLPLLIILLAAWLGLATGWIIVIALTVTALWILAYARRFAGYPYLKLTAEGLVDSRLSETQVMPWLRMREPQVVEHRIEYEDSYENKTFFIFIFDRPPDGQKEPPAHFPALRKYVNRYGSELGIHSRGADEYPVKVAVDLDAFTMPSTRIGRLLIERAGASRK